jgi:hypothetical protein
MKLFKEAKAPGLATPVRISKLTRAIHDFNSALDKSSEPSLRATLHHNIGAAHYHCALLCAAPDRITSSAASIW